MDKKQYKLNLYNKNGEPRHVSPIVLYDASKKNGDIMSSISSIKWMTMDEICESIWRLERKMKNPLNRSRKSIELAVGDLIETNLVIKK